MLNLRIRIRSDMPSWCLDLFKTCCSAIEDKKGSLDGFLNLKRTFNWLSCFYVYELMVPGSVGYMLLPGLSLMYGYIINSQHFKIVQSIWWMVARKQNGSRPIPTYYKNNWTTCNIITIANVNYCYKLRKSNSTLYCPTHTTYDVHS